MVFFSWVLKGRPGRPFIPTAPIRNQHSGTEGGKTLLLPGPHWELRTLGLREVLEQRTRGPLVASLDHQLHRLPGSYGGKASVGTAVAPAVRDPVGPAVPKCGCTLESPVVVVQLLRRVRLLRPHGL